MSRYRDQLGECGSLRGFPLTISFFLLRVHYSSSRTSFARFYLRWYIRKAHMIKVTHLYLIIGRTKRQLKTQLQFFRRDVSPENCSLQSSTRARLQLDQNCLFAEIDLPYFLFLERQRGWNSVNIIYNICSVCAIKRDLTTNIVSMQLDKFPSIFGNRVIVNR